MTADRFFNACIALDLLERNDEKIYNTPLSAQFLVKGEQTYLGDFILKYDQVSYPRWNDLVQKLRDWRPNVTDKGQPEEDDQGVAGMHARHNFSLMVGRALGEAYDFSRHKVLLDVGGGTGAYSISICKAYERLRAIIIDLPLVARVASGYIDASDLSRRVEVCVCDFKEEALPSGFDVALVTDLLSLGLSR